MKYKITAKEYESLSDEFKSEYVKSAKGYVLDLNEYSNLEDDLKDYEELKGKYKELKKEVEELSSNSNYKVEKLSKRNSELEKLLGETEAKYKTQLENYEINSFVDKIAGELTDNPALLKPHLKVCVSSEWDENNVKLIFRNDKGELLKDEGELKKYFRENDTFKSVLKVNDKIENKTTQFEFKNVDKQSKSFNSMSVDELVDLV